MGTLCFPITIWSWTASLYSLCPILSNKRKKVTLSSLIPPQVRLPLPQEALDSLTTASIGEHVISSSRNSLARHIGVIIRKSFHLQHRAFQTCVS